MKRYEVRVSDELSDKLQELAEVSKIAPDRLIAMAVSAMVEEKRPEKDFILFLRRTHQYDDAVQAYRASDDWSLESLFCDYTSSIEDYYLLSYEEAMEELEKEEEGR